LTASSTSTQRASSDSWTIVFRGIGTHGAKPHLGKDPVTAAGHFLGALQTIVGRVVNPLQPAVVNACSVQAGNPDALNVIPDLVEIGRLAEGVAVMFGLAAEYRFLRRIPPVINDADAARRALAAAAAVCGARVQTDFPPSTAADDFA
jgi:hippurate hydrolase